MAYICCEPGFYQNRDEKIRMLKEYRENLQKEARVVEERIKELEKKQF